MTIDTRYRQLRPKSAQHPIVEKTVLIPAIRPLHLYTGNAWDGRHCSNCRTETTPLWRRSPLGAVVCNACGIYLKANKSARPVRYHRKKQLGEGDQERLSSPYVREREWGESGGEASVNVNVNVSVAVGCSNCGTPVSPIWRRDENKSPICNACGLYLRFHNAHRPRSMWKTKTAIRRRARFPSTGNQESSSNRDGDSPESVENTPTVSLDQMRISLQNAHSQPENRCLVYPDQTQRPIQESHVHVNMPMPIPEVDRGIARLPTIQFLLQQEA